jgi:cyclase
MARQEALGGRNIVIDSIDNDGHMNAYDKSDGRLFVFKGVYKAILINYLSAARRDELIMRALGHQRG